MCGITGILQHSVVLGREEMRAAAGAMTSVLARRGPDAEGIWVDDQGNVALGHRRLSILDLSPEGAQPMAGPGGRIHIAFNGEIYNHNELRAALRQKGYTFRGHSDTEVLVSAIEAWGVASTLERLVGMYAFAAWDAEERNLYLARDRMGEKPLYYGQIGASVVFASELKSLRAFPGWHDIAIDQGVLSLYLRYGYVPAPYSIYKGIYKLMPGSMLVIPYGSGHVDEAYDPLPVAGGAKRLRSCWYWNLEDRAVALIGSDNGRSPEQYVDALDAALRRSIRDQMVADVPLGGFLSGGVDSSTVAAIMQSLSDRPINTFTIGFGEKEFNEAEHASAIARHLGTHHTELYVTPTMALGLIPSLPNVYDEPFADSSQLPTLLLTRMARQHVTVCLSGDAGDELFCGYNRYVYGEKINRALNRCPSVMRRSMAAIVERMPTDLLYRCLQGLAPLYPALRSLNNANVRARMVKLIDALRADSLVSLYRRLVSFWPDPQLLLSGSVPHRHEFLIEQTSLSRASVLDQMMIWDQRTYLPDDNLVKVDRAAMFNSLETRLPLLDHRIVELAMAMPVDVKIRAGETKWVLRQVLYRYIPRQLMERPKMGFSVPIAHWLRHELRDWAEALLAQERLHTQGFFQVDVVRRCWQEHLTGRADNSMPLWALLMFMAWHESV
jgi:asparagine synthase (glutamine-hydrolysing)